MRLTAALLLPSCAAYPVYLECANDTATRLKVGGAAVMAGPPQACGADCACSLTAAAGAAGATTLTITTTSAVNFAVRVPDGTGTLSSGDASLKATANCPGQMYTVGTAGAPDAGAFTVTLTPPARERDLLARLEQLRGDARAAQRGGGGAAVAARAAALGTELRDFYTANPKAPTTFTVAYTDKFGVPLSVVTYPPAPAPPPAALYKCKAGTCTLSPTGVDKATCQSLCSAPAPTPPTPQQLYKCKQGTCTPDATGVDLATCQSLCTAPAPPVPPPTPGQLYKCHENTCTPDAAGVDLPTCQQLCKAPPPPGALYRCTGNTCLVSDTGVDLATCQSLCRAPAPPGPPPLPPNPCGGNSCCLGLEGIAVGVAGIVEAVENCAASGAKCAEDILASVAGFIAGIAELANC